MVGPTVTMRPPANVRWKIVDGAVFMLQERLQGVVNGCIVRRMHEIWTPLWERIVDNKGLDELNDEDRDAINTLIKEGLLEEAQP